MASHSSFLAWETPWTKEPGEQATVHGVTRSWTQLCDYTGAHTFQRSVYLKFLNQTIKSCHSPTQNPLMAFRCSNGIPLQSSCLENPMDGGAWWAAVHGVAKSRTRLSDFTFTFHFSLSCIGGGNGNPLQCSCLENPRDGRAWWAAVYGVAQSWTRLKRLSSSSSSKPLTWKKLQ